MNKQMTMQYMIRVIKMRYKFFIFISGVLLTLLPIISNAQLTAATPITLGQLMSTVLATHPATKAQMILEKSAQALVESAHWQFYPTLSLAVEGAQANNSALAYRGDSAIALLRIEQPLWTGGRLTAGIEKAEAGTAVHEATLAEIKQQLALRVLQIYGDWLLAHLKIQAQDQSVTTHTRLHDQVKRRIAEGVSSESDLVLAVSRLQAINADNLVAHAQYDTALARLQQLLGEPTAAPTFNMAIASPQPISDSAQTLIERALAINPTLRKGHAQANLQQATLAERRADLVPNLYLRAEHQYGNYSYPDAPAENRIFIGVNSHLGAGLSTLSNIEAAKLQYQAAVEEIEAQRRLLTEQILADYVLVTSSAQRQVTQRASLAASQQVAESYDRQFLAGRKTWQDVMNAARELTQSEIQLADTQASQVIASWRLTIYTQGLDAIMGAGP